MPQPAELRGHIRRHYKELHSTEHAVENTYLLTSLGPHCCGVVWCAVLCCAVSDPREEVFSLFVAAVGLAGFALALALVEQIVLETNLANVSRGSRVFESGHVSIRGVELQLASFAMGREGGRQC